MTRRREESAKNRKREETYSGLLRAFAFSAYAHLTGDAEKGSSVRAAERGWKGGAKWLWDGGKDAERGSDDTVFKGFDRENHPAKPGESNWRVWSNSAETARAAVGQTHSFVARDFGELS